MTNLEPTEPQEKQKLAVLAGEILQDAQKLVEQQVALAKLQLFEDWGSFKPVAVWLALGIAALSSAGLLFSLTIVFVLHESTQLSLWACFGITLILFLTVGAISLAIARAKSKDLSFVND